MKSEDGDDERILVEDDDSEENVLLDSKNCFQPAEDCDSLASNRSDIFSLCHSFSDGAHSNMGGHQCEKGDFLLG